MGKSNRFLDSKLFHTIATVVAWVLTVGVIVFSILTFTQASENNFESTSHYMAFIFIFLGVIHVLGYLKDTKNGSVGSLLMAVISIGLGVLVMFAKYNVYIFSIAAGIYAASIIISRILKLLKKHTTHDIVLNIIVIVLSIVLAVGFFQKVDNDVMSNFVLVECIFISLCVLVEAVSISFAQLKVTTFMNVILRTFALEILLGLAALIVGASLILMHVEPTMSAFPDALWYCFAVVTTIGFGDFAAATATGRVVTVILGIYGIIVVAVLTSIIVNYYNETYGKRDAREVRKINDR